MGRGELRPRGGDGGDEVAPPAEGPLSVDRLAPVAGFGRAVTAPGYVSRPETVGELREIFEAARARDWMVTLRGAGRSYGDAALRPEAMVLDLRGMNRILAWDPESGQIDIEPGVTIEQIWRSTLPQGWWPAVVPGTMKPTLGGCLAMNVHGKNNWRAGTVGDHCLEVDLLPPSGEVLTLRPETHPELFRGVIGSFGQLGVLTRIRWQLKRVETGSVRVRALSVGNLHEMLRWIDDAKDTHEYVVGWLDAFARGSRLGRGQIHLASSLAAADHPRAAGSLELEGQRLPARFFGVFPRSKMWWFARFLTHRPGMRYLNWSKYLLAATVQRNKSYDQSLVAFQFLLDYIPGWERAYPPDGGLIQHQSFVPTAAAEEVFRQQLEICQRHRMESFLAVLKRHRADRFLLSHAVDGFSMALDFPVTPKNRRRLWAMIRELSEPVVAAGGRFYPAKDAALPADLFQATLKGDRLDRFSKLKGQLDPQGILTSALAERLLPPA